VFAGQPYHCAVTRFKDDPLVSPCLGTHFHGNLNSTNKTIQGCTKDNPAPDVLEGALKVKSKNTLYVI
jgi:hypothetical protein